MLVLALDAATEGCSVALLSGDELISRFAEGGRAHAQQVLDMVEAVWAEAEVSVARLDGIAASIGPGAFTGVRISVAVAQGLAFGAGLRVVPVSTLEALAFQVIRRGARHALACLDARMGEVYWGCFAADLERGLGWTCRATVGPPDSVALPVPDAYRRIRRGFGAYPALAAPLALELDPNDSEALPNARGFARLGALRLARGARIDPGHLRP